MCMLTELHNEVRMMLCVSGITYVSKRMYGLVRLLYGKLLPLSGSLWLFCSHNLIKAFLCGPVTLSVHSAQVEESGRLDEVIDHEAAF